MSNNQHLDSHLDSAANIEHVTNRITANNQNLAILKKHFAHCFGQNGEFDLNRFQQELSANEIDFYKESYGIDWLGKSYAHLLANDEASTLLRADETHNQQSDNIHSQNLLLKGDNLEVLKHLSHAYYESVKMIYIDPPYNTGSDGFVYQDDRKFSIKDLQQLAGLSQEKAERILSFTRSKSNSHSAWLTFMYPRLYIAKQLLRDDGVIFISIDDNEVAQLRLLMDELFGEENVDSMIWRKAGIGRDGKMKNTTTYRKDHEYILIAYKNVHTLNKSLEKPNWVNSYGNPDNDIRGNYKAGSISRTEEASNKDSDKYYSVTSPSGKVFQRQFDIIEEDFIKLDNDNRIYWGKNGDAVPAIKIFENEEREVNTSSIIFKEQDEFESSLYEDNEANTTSGSKELDRLFEIDDIGNKIRPKPSKLLKKIVQIGTNQEDIVLDFFAGSGTTADAVMQLNTKDGGNRQFIMVQLPEAIDPKTNKTAYDFIKNKSGVAEPSIFDITRERLIRSAKKIQSDNAASKEPIDLSSQDMGFKIFETIPIWDNYDMTSDAFSPQMVLFDESQLTDEDIKALLITWKTYDGSPLTEDYQLYRLTATGIEDYHAYYVNQTLYLMYQGFATGHLANLLEKIDNDTHFNPTSIIAFGYHFDSKPLRELSENIKSYTNKKSIDIDFIIRY